MEVENESEVGQSPSESARRRPIPPSRSKSSGRSRSAERARSFRGRKSDDVGSPGEPPPSSSREASLEEDSELQRSESGRSSSRDRRRPIGYSPDKEAPVRVGLGICSIQPHPFPLGEETGPLLPSCGGQIFSLLLVLSSVTSFAISMAYVPVKWLHLK